MANENMKYPDPSKQETNPQKSGGKSAGERNDVQDEENPTIGEKKNPNPNAQVSGK